MKNFSTKFLLLKRVAFFLLLISLSFSIISCRDVLEDSHATQEDRTKLLFSQKISAEIDKQRLGLEQSWSDFEPTGLYVRPNSTLELLATIKSGSDLPAIIIGTYSRYEKNPDPKEVQLQAGLNKINCEAGGLIYIRFISDKPNSNNKVEIEFKNGFSIAPLYKKGVTTASDWKNQLQKYNDTPDVTLISDRTFSVYSIESANAWKNQNINEVLDGLDNVIEIEDYISGLVNDTSSIHSKMKHKLLLTQTDEKDAYMYATYYRTAYFSPYHEYAFTNKILTTAGWGPWHEIGHMHQQEAWTWEELGEVTVNIYSLAVERQLGFRPSRLVEEDSWGLMTNFVNKTSEIKNFNDDKQIDVFVRLCMFEQLRMAFGDDFYKELHKQTRLEKPQSNTREEKMIYFMVKASLISGKDLTNFFTKWGFKNVDAGFKKIKNLNLSKPEKDLTLLRE